MKNNKQNFFINKLKEYFFNNIIKTLIFLITTEGIIYFGFYFLDKGFFPIIENEYFIQLSIIFFLASLIIFAIIFFIFFIGEQYVILISNDSNIFDIVFALIILILTIISLIIIG